jgi:hypothetical protein
MKQLFSDFLKVNGRDIIKSFLMAFIGSVVTALYTIVKEGKLPTGAEWKTILIIGAASALSYLVKNFFTNSNDEFLKKETK